MSTLHLMRGLPASGKTTLARELVAATDRGTMLRLNRDDLRRSMVDPEYRRPEYAIEQRITGVQRTTARDALHDGVSVVVDDTNLRLRYAREWATLAAECGSELVVHDVTTDVDECVRRDNRRVGVEQVGEDVIRDMHARFVAQYADRPWPAITARDTVEATTERYEPDELLRSAVVVDVDGTVALIDGRGPYETSRYAEDLPNGPVVDLVRELAHVGHVVVFCSGRSEEFRDVTEAWLTKHAEDDHLLRSTGWELHMRPAGDNRNDAVVKLELFDQHIRDRYRVRFVLDDRDRVVKAWRSIGLTVLQVAEGHF